MIIKNNIPVIKKQYLLHYLSDHMYYEETKCSATEIIEQIKPYHDVFTRKTVKRNLESFSNTLRKRFPIGNPAFNYFPDLQKGTYNNNSTNNKNIVIPTKEKRISLHTQIFYKFLHELIQKFYSEKYILKSKVISTKGKPDFVDYKMTKSFAPIFIGIIDNYKVEKKGWKSYKEIVLQDSNSFIKEIWSNKLESYGYAKSEWLEVWNETAKNWLDLFLPDGLFELCNNIQELQEEFLLFSTPDMLAMNLLYLTDYFSTTPFFTLTGQDQFYTYINQLFNRSPKDPENLLLFNMKNVKNFYRESVDKDRIDYIKSFQERYKNCKTIKNLISSIHLDQLI